MPAGQRSDPVGSGGHGHGKNGSHAHPAGHSRDQGDPHDGGHAHSHVNVALRGRALAVALVANSVLLVGQLVGAWVFGSLALAADSVHQASDVIGLGLAIVAARLAARPPSSRYTYGLRRAEVGGALINAGLLGIGALVIVVEALRRIGDPGHLDGVGVLIVAVIGLAVNALSAWWLSRVAGENLNMRAAVAHLAADAAGSVGVIIAAVAVIVADAGWVDPVVSLLIAVMIARHALVLGRSGTRILMDVAPTRIDAETVRRLITDHRDVTDVHHLHLWNLDSETVALTAHVEVATEDLHHAQVVTRELEDLLVHEGVDHTTLQLECHPCAQDGAPADC
ncbi:MAG: cation diffusion facilitator family transporter [Actinomycetota bacterium]|nr:cation diffusion facilitator family transporter [Actinomycetota bacterium]